MAGRFHAWQSSMLFAFMFVIHVIFSWTAIISWFLLIGDLVLIGFLTMHAYRDGRFGGLRERALLLTGLQLRRWIAMRFRSLGRLRRRLRMTSEAGCDEFMCWTCLSGVMGLTGIIGVRAL